MKQKGFTFLEMLLVLSIISILSVVTYFNVAPLYERQKVEQFLKQFSQDILYMQQLAINRRNLHMLRWSPEKHMYSIWESGDKRSLFIREYERDIKIDLNTFPNPMTYNANGNINQGGTILLSYRSRTYEIVFQLGRGRFTYREVPKRIGYARNARIVKFIDDGCVTVASANTPNYARKKKYSISV
ncbi:type II secretion system protein [Bacillus sp. XF8]|nr:type II secretion system protein [Bacillus sp. XF8]